MTGHIFIYGDIGTKVGQVSVKNVKAQIDKSATDYIVHVFSGGGDVFEGYGIYNALKNDTLKEDRKTPKPVTIQIEGICASIATLIAAAGQKTLMNRTGEFMIHNPLITDLKGDARELRSVANQLDKIKSILIDVYQRKTGLPKEKLWELYDNETWLTAEEAKTMGFVDEVQDAIKAVATIDLTTFKMENKENGLIKFFKNLVTLTKFKNEFTEALADGRVIIVMSDDEDWTGKQVVLEDGSPLPAGTHALASGKTITVDEGGAITQVGEPQAAADQEKAKATEEMNNKIAELEKQLAEARQAQSSAETTAKEASAKVEESAKTTAKFENKFNEMSKEFLALKAEMSKTFGETDELKTKGPAIKAALDEEEVYDPMGETYKKHLQARNLIKS
jgi:ATP-dependent Clp protease, protease subunit